MKRLFTLLIAAVAMLATQAATTYLYVAGTKVTGTGYVTNKYITSGTVHYNASNNTLTLTNATINVSGSNGIALETTGTTVVFSGTNTITATSSDKNGIRLDDSGLNITLKGASTSAKLIVKGGSSKSGLHVHTKCTCNVSSLNIEASGKWGVDGSNGTSSESLILQKDVTLQATGTTAAIGDLASLTTDVTVGIVTSGSPYFSTAKHGVVNSSKTLMTAVKYGKVTPYNVTVDGVPVHSANYSAINGDNISGTVSYTPSTSTLTLNGATISSTITNPLVNSANANLTILVTSTSTLKTSNYYALYLGAATTVKVNKGATLNVSCTATASGTAAICCSRNTTFMGPGKLVATGNQYGIRGASGVTVKLDGIVLDAYGQNTCSVGGMSALTVENCKLASGYSFQSSKGGVCYGSTLSTSHVKTTLPQSYNITVGGHDVHELNYDNITGEGISGKVSYNPQTMTLTLNNATIDNNSGYTINLQRAAIIRLIGTNTVKANYWGINAWENLIIAGTGTLNVDGIALQGGTRLTIQDGCKLNISGMLWGQTDNSPTLYVSGYDTKITIKSGVAKCLSGFAAVSLSDGLTYTNPAGAYYDTSTRKLVHSNGVAVSSSGCTIERVVDYGLTVAGVNLTSQSAETITGTGISGTVKYDHSTRTLTLSGATINYTGPAVLVKPTYDGTLKVQLTGTNRMNTQNYSAMSLQHATTITGTGSLTTSADIVAGNSSLLTVNGGCQLSALMLRGASDTQTDRLAIAGAATKVTLTKGISGFGAVTLSDGLDYADPAGAVYNTTKKQLMTEDGSQTVSNCTIRKYRYYGLKVAGVPVSSENENNITGTGISGSVKYTGAELVMNGATINGQGKYTGIEVTDRFPYDDLIFRLTGTNKVTNTGTQPMGRFQRSIHLNKSEGSLEGTGGFIIEKGDLNVLCSLSAGYLAHTGTTPGQLYIGNPITVKLTGDTGGTMRGFKSVELGSNSRLSYLTPAGATYNATGRYLADASGKRVTTNVWIDQLYTYDVTVGGVKVTNVNYSNVTGTTISGTVSYDDDTRTLTLNGATISNGASTPGIEYVGPTRPLTIRLVGKNSITGSYQRSINAYIPTTVVITGTGSLTATQELVGNTFTVSGGCQLAAKSLHGRAALRVEGASTSVRLTSELKDFEEVVFADGLGITTPEGGKYSTALSTVVDAKGAKYTGNIVIAKMPDEPVYPPVTVTARSYSREYGTDNPTFSYTATGGTLSGQPALSTTATRQSPVGTYPISVAAGTVSTKNVTYVNGTLTVTPAQVTVSAGHYTMEQGSDVPDFTALTYMGWRLGEGPSVLTVQPTVSCSVTKTSLPGVYPVSVMGAQAQNYTFYYQPGTVTVTVASAVSDVAADGPWPADVYDTTGRLVQRQAASAERLSPGVYIVRGRKLVVKK